MYQSGLRLLLLSWVSLLGANASGDSTARLTPAAAGPYRIDGNRILDSKDRPYLMRGTELPTLTLNRADIAGDGKEFGAFSPSALISIRQRLNMNGVRLPVSPLEFEESGVYRALVQEVVESANRLELLVVLAADPVEQLTEPVLAHFWERCAGEFKGHPNVFFAPGHGEALVDAIRSGGAAQPVIVDGEFPVHDRNAIYQATPRYAATRTDEDRWRQFGFLSTGAPVMVNDMDPQLDRKSAECAAFPGDPGAATKLVQENLAGWRGAASATRVRQTPEPYAPSSPEGHPTTASILTATRTPFRNRPNGVRFYSFWITAAPRVFAAMADSISATRLTTSAGRHRRRSFTITGCTTWPGSSRFPCPISGFTHIRRTSPTSASLRPRRCAISR
jgi:hypothetical protein